MFGGFSMRYNGRELSLGSLSGLQMVQLLQLLLHYRDQGVTRDMAKSVLFGDRDVDDVSHSLRNIIYNLRKKLKELGLPDSQYVVKRKGVYYWTDDIPVILGELGQYLDTYKNGVCKYYKDINAIQKAISEELPCGGYVTTEGLTPKADNLHFNSVSLRELGKRYFAEYKRITENRV